MTPRRVRRETAVVFRAPDGRRFFTEEAAYNRALWLELKLQFGPCQCDQGECELHAVTEIERAAMAALLKQEDCERTVPAAAYRGPAERMAQMEADR